MPVDAKIRLLPLPPQTQSAASDAATAAASLATPVATPPAASTDGAEPTPSAILEPTIPPTLTVPASSFQDRRGARDAPSSGAEGTASTSAAADEEPTLGLVARILDTGIANLTVHCRTQEMRSREPALHERMRGITELGKQRGIPVVCNGDAVGGGKDAAWGNFDQVCAKTGASRWRDRIPKWNRSPYSR